MNLHVVTNLFAPDELAGASLFTDLARYFRDKGWDVRVTTTFPYYPAWKLAAADAGVPLREEVFEGIPLRRVSMRVPARASAGGRLLADASFLASILRHGRFPGWTPDVVLTASPMFSQCLAQRFLYPTRRVPKLIVVQDFVVDAALDLGIVRFPGFGALFLALERWAFESAGTLLTISPDMLAKLKGKVTGRRLLCVPNWIHDSLAAEAGKLAALGVKRLSNTLLYAGNLGRKQGLPDFVRTFSEAGSDWKLAIHGGGAEAAELSHSLDGKSGVSLGGVLDEPAYVMALATASACLVTQRPGVGANFLPSKLLPALATATPVLAVCGEDSPLAREVREGGYGCVIPPGGSQILRDALAAWSGNPGQLARLSQKAAERRRMFSRETILSIYKSELMALVDASGG